MKTKMFVKHAPNWKLQKKNLVAGFEQVLTININI